MLTTIFLNVNGTNTAMFATLNLGGKKISNCSAAINNTDVANKSYVDSKIGSSSPSNPNLPSHKINIFKYLMRTTDEISTEYGWISNKIDDLSWSFRQNKKVLNFQTIKDGVNYRVRFGFRS